MKFKNKYWVHIVLWGAMILFLFIAPPIKDKLTIVEGKPVDLGDVSLESAGIIRFNIDKISEVKSGKQMLYRVIGWSFIEEDVKPTNYDVFLVLSSADETYFFPTIRGEREDVEKSFPEFTVDLTQSGFTVFIARELMKNGEYRIGFLHKDNESGETIYQATEQYLVKTLNKINLSE